jgi:hypothetical protein
VPAVAISGHFKMAQRPLNVIPANAGIQVFWTPAFAGVTV